MKIVCDSCGAKYSVSDEKVAGKVFRIRCKKCNAAIVVRGENMAMAQKDASTSSQNMPAADTVAAGTPSSPSTPPDAIWHVVVGADQKGPLTELEVKALLNSAEISLESYVWREGFDNWKLVQEVAEFSASPAAAPAGIVSHHQSWSGDEEDATSIASSPFGAADIARLSNQRLSEPPPDSSNAPFAARGQVDRSESRVDLFAAANVAAEHAFANNGSQGSEASQVSRTMTGARNESSLLFSLSNLQALAKGGPGPASTQGGGVTPQAGVATRATQVTEGSGLIDIRALANATSAAKSVAPTNASHAIDDLLSIGTSGGSFGTPLGAPVLVPEKTRWSPQFIIAISVAGAALLGLIAVVILLLKQNAAQPVVAPPTVANVAPQQPSTPGQPSPEPSSEKPSAAGPKHTVEQKPVEAEEAISASAAAVKEKDRAGGSSRRGGGRHGSEASNEKSAPQAAAPAASSERRSGGGDLDSLLDRALGGAPKPPPGDKARTPSEPEARGAGGGDDLPDSPSRDAVLSALRSVGPQVSSCGNGQAGVATTAITVSGATGQVTAAQVSGPFAGTPVGACVSRVVKGAKFPRFKRPTFKVTFPYTVQ